MSFKTNRLVALFPDAYAPRDRDALIHRFLDAIGNELMESDTAVKNLLKSHWINYAEGCGLDGLASLLGVERRKLPDGSVEGDDTFRPLLKSTVPSFIGGGTVEAVKGAVRSALGLPYDLALLRTQFAGADGNLSENAQLLIDGLEALVQIEEFSPKSEVILGHANPDVDGSQVVVDVNFSTVQPVPPSIEWSFTKGCGRRLSLVLEDTGEGIKSKPGFQLREGETLLLANSATGKFSASIGTTDVSNDFTDIDGTSSPRLPTVPQGASRWVYSSAGSGLFDVSTYDNQQTFNAAAFSVKMAWVRYQPLVFDVIVPYFVDKAVKSLLNRSQYQSKFKLFKGTSLDAIQQVVNHSRAAGVRGMVQYSLNLPRESMDEQPWEDHAAEDIFSGEVEYSNSEVQDAEEELLVGALDNNSENHETKERFAIGGVFNVAVFDGSFGFQ